MQRTLWIALAAALLYGVQWYTGMDLGLGGSGVAAPPGGEVARAPGSEPASQGEAAGRGPDAGELFARLFREERSGVVVEGAGVVERVLRDDLKGSRHQRFIVDVGADKTLLIAHNIDLAPRVPEIRAGDAVGFRGQYEWNDRGGVVHWTHHDPQRRRTGGWIEHEGHRYE